MAIAAVSLDDVAALTRVTDQLRLDLAVGETYEFHWAKIPREFRSEYFRRVTAIDFAAWVLVIDKAEVEPIYSTYRPERALASWIGSLFAHIPGEAVTRARLIVDDQHVRSRLVQEIRAEVSSTLKSRGLDNRLRGARGHESHRERGLQLADMIAGAVLTGEGQTTIAGYGGLVQKLTVIKLRRDA
jgi:hypothetical protein